MHPVVLGEEWRRTAWAAGEDEAAIAVEAPDHAPERAGLAVAERHPARREIGIVGTPFPRLRQCARRVEREVARRPLRRVAVPGEVEQREAEALVGCRTSVRHQEWVGAERVLVLIDSRTYLLRHIGEDQLAEQHHLRDACAELEVASGQTGGELQRVLSGHGIEVDHMPGHGLEERMNDHALQLGEAARWLNGRAYPARKQFGFGPVGRLQQDVLGGWERNRTHPSLWVEPSLYLDGAARFAGAARHGGIAGVTRTQRSPEAWSTPAGRMPGRSAPSKPSCRHASKATMATAFARLMLRLPGRMGIVRRASGPKSARTAGARPVPSAPKTNASPGSGA